MIRVLTAALGAVFLLLAPAHSAEVESGRCAEHLRYGAPSVDGIHNLTLVCHAGYAAWHDDDLLVPRLVAYTLTGEHTLGCEARSNKFHPEEQLPRDRRATPADYVRSGYDRGHQAPAADFAWDAAQSLDSFSMVNMAPQAPGLNRKQWERLEETVRAWAWGRQTTLEIYVGPVVDKRHNTIGKNHVAVPAGFWKVVIDTGTGDNLAFIAKNRDTPKGKLDPWLTTVKDVEESAGIVLPLRAAAHKDSLHELWPVNIKAWQKAHKQACAR